MAEVIGNGIIEGGMPRTLTVSGTITPDITGRYLLGHQSPGTGQFDWTRVGGGGGLNITPGPNWPDIAEFYFTLRTTTFSAAWYQNLDATGVLMAFPITLVPGFGTATGNAVLSLP